MRASVQLQIQVPPGTPQEVGDYILDLLARLEAGAEDGGDVTVDFTMAERTIESALAYFKRAWLARFEYLQRLHDALVEMGYEVKLPESRPESRNQYPYLRYLRADESRTLGSINSGSFTFWGKVLQRRLAEDPLGQVTRDAVRYQLDSDESLDRIIEVARDELNR